MRNFKIKKTLSSPHTKVCSLLLVFWMIQDLKSVKLLPHFKNWGFKSMDITTRIANEERHLIKLGRGIVI